MKGKLSELFVVSALVLFWGPVISYTLGIMFVLEQITLCFLQPKCLSYYSGEGVARKDEFNKSLHRRLSRTLKYVMVEKPSQIRQTEKLCGGR